MQARLEAVRFVPADLSGVRRGGGMLSDTTFEIEGSGYWATEVEGSPTDTNPLLYKFLLSDKEQAMRLDITPTDARTIIAALTAWLEEVEG